MLKLNEDPKVHGVYLHLPPALLTGRLLNTIKPEKDVDGYERNERLQSLTLKVLNRLVVFVSMNLCTNDL